MNQQLKADQHIRPALLATPEGIEADVKLLSAPIQQQLDNNQSRGEWLPYV